MINLGSGMPMTFMVKNLLIINGILFFASFVFENIFGIHLVNILGLYYMGSEQFQIWQLVTHLFMHGGLLHLLFNMFALWIFGTSIENYIGPKRFLQYYLITGIGAALLHMLTLSIAMKADEGIFIDFNQNPNPENLEKIITKYRNHSPKAYQNSIRFLKEFENNSSDYDFIFAAKRYADQYKEKFVNNNTITVGASGAVYGVLLAFGLLFPNVLILIWFVFPVKAKYIVIFFGLIELFRGISNTPGDNVAHFAHLGGMIFGFLLLKFWKIKKPFDHLRR